MKLTNVRYMTYKVGPTKLKKGRSMSIDSSMITSRLQNLINRGYFRLEAVEAEVVLVKNHEPDENLPDTDPAPEVPSPVKAEPVQEVVEEPPVVVEKVEEKPKLTRRRKKKASAKSEE